MKLLLKEFVRTLFNVLLFLGSCLGVLVLVKNFARFLWYFVVIFWYFSWNVLGIFLSCLVIFVLSIRFSYFLLNFEKNVRDFSG